jgi:ABC-type transport system substrate-binding protein
LEAGFFQYLQKYVETVGQEKAAKNPIGSGCYRVVEHKGGESLKFEAVEKHWRLVPEYKYVIYQLAPEESTRVAMLKTKELDVVLIDTPRVLNDLDREPGFKTALQPGGYKPTFWFGGMLLPEDKKFVKGYHRQDPWVDVRVREAMNIAIDRKAIVDSIYFGKAKASAIWTSQPGSDELKPYPYDPREQAVG